MADDLAGRTTIIGRALGRSVDADKLVASTKTTKNFYATVAWEKVDTIDADVVVGYVDDLTVKQFFANKLAAKLGAVRTKSAYILSDTMIIGALSQPTVLSVGYTLERVLPALSTAAKNAA